MKIIKIKKDAFDREFRFWIREFLNSAKKEAIVITGEGHAFEYQDLRWAVENASKRGVKLKVYAVSPKKEFINKWLSLGAEVYMGKKPADDHYFVVDGASYVISFQHPREKVGVRSGEAHLGDKKGAQEQKKLFNALVKDAEKITKPDLKADPLYQIYLKPANCAVKTDSSKIEYFG